MTKKSIIKLKLTIKIHFFQYFCCYRKKRFTKNLHRATKKEFREYEAITIKVLNFFFLFFSHNKLEETIVNEPKIT